MYSHTHMNTLNTCHEEIHTLDEGDVQDAHGLHRIEILRFIARVHGVNQLLRVQNGLHQCGVQLGAHDASNVVVQGAYNYNKCEGFQIQICYFAAEQSNTRTQIRFAPLLQSRPAALTTQVVNSSSSHATYLCSPMFMMSRRATFSENSTCGFFMKVTDTARNPGREGCRSSSSMRARADMRNSETSMGVLTRSVPTVTTILGSPA